MKVEKRRGRPKGTGKKSEDHNPFYPYKTGLTTKREDINGLIYVVENENEKEEIHKFVNYNNRFVSIKPHLIEMVLNYKDNNIISPTHQANIMKLFLFLMKNCQGVEKYGLSSNTLAEEFKTSKRNVQAAINWMVDKKILSKQKSQPTKVMYNLNILDFSVGLNAPEYLYNKDIDLFNQYYNPNYKPIKSKKTQQPPLSSHCG